MGVLIPGHDTDADGLSDGVGENDSAFLGSFPYVAYPHSGSDADPHSAPRQRRKGAAAAARRPLLLLEEDA